MLIKNLRSDFLQFIHVPLQILIENYETVMKDYLVDDQEQEKSILALTVQLLTVPSIAQSLIEHNNGFFNIANTFETNLAENQADGKIARVEGLF